MCTSSRALVSFAALLFLTPALFYGQTYNPPVNFNSVAVGSASGSTNVSFPAPANATFVLTYGTDFAVSTPSCSGGICTVAVAFTPSHPGIRKGAISAYAGSTLLAVTPVYGLGLGPELKVMPSVITSIVGQTNSKLTTAQLFGIAARSDNQLYIADSARNQIFSVIPNSGDVELIAGTGSGGFSGDNGPALSAQLNQPSGLAIDNYGNLLIADTNNQRIRKLNLSTGIITTIAGDGNARFFGDAGPAVAASFNAPSAVAVASNGDILVSDTLNDRIRIITAASGNINTLAGNGAAGFFGDNGPATSAQLNGPVGLALDSGDNLYVADVLNNCIRKVSAGVITTVAGQGGASGGFAGDGGAATSALLRFPYGVSLDAGGNLYITDDQNNAVRKVTGDSSHIITTVAGTTNAGYLGDGGIATSAWLKAPTYISADPSGNLFFLDSGNQAIRKLSAAPSPVSFAQTSLGTASNSTLTVSNTGNQSLNILIGLPTGFTLTGGSCGASAVLAAGQACTDVVSYTPNTGVPTSGTIGIASNTLNSTSTTLGIAAAQSNGLFYVPVTPCRVVDTRNANGTFGGPLLSANSTRDFAIRNSPNCAGTIPSNADVQAYALNVTVVPRGLLDFLTVYPTAGTRPLASTLNSYDGRTKANAAIVAANLGDSNRSVSVYSTGSTDLIIDINGYYVPQTTTGSLAYFPVPPCRAFDTRQGIGGSTMAAEEVRNFPLQTTCNLPSSAQAYALNFTVSSGNAPVPWLTAWPTGVTQPLASTLNAPTGQITANAAIVQAGNSGNISVYVKAATDVIVDVSGYYAPATSAPSGLSLYNVVPCRAYDSRVGNGGPVNGVSATDVRAACNVSPLVQNFVMNATVVPTASLGYITLWAHGSAQPLQSTLNAYDGQVTSNLAVVPTSDGAISSFTFAPTALIFDLFGYFAP